jgi:hypothetical protein
LIDINEFKIEYTLAFISAYLSQSPNHDAIGTTTEKTGAGPSSGAGRSPNYQNPFIIKSTNHQIIKSLNHQITSSFPV